MGQPGWPSLLALQHYVAVAVVEMRALSTSVSSVLSSPGVFCLLVRCATLNGASPLACLTIATAPVVIITVGYVVYRTSWNSNTNVSAHGFITRQLLLLTPAQLAWPIALAIAAGDSGQLRSSSVAALQLLDRSFAIPLAALLLPTLPVDASYKMYWVRGLLIPLALGALVVQRGEFPLLMAAAIVSAAFRSLAEAQGVMALGPLDGHVSDPYIRIRCPAVNDAQQHVYAVWELQILTQNCCLCLMAFSLAYPLDGRIEAPGDAVSWIAVLLIALVLMLPFSRFRTMDDVDPARTFGSVTSVVDMVTVLGLLLVEGVAEQVNPIEAAAFGTLCGVLSYTEIWTNEAAVQARITELLHSSQAFSGADKNAIIALQPYVQPCVTRWLMVEGVVNGDPKAWKHAVPSTRIPTNMDDCFGTGIAALPDRDIFTWSAREDNESASSSDSEAEDITTADRQPLRGNSRQRVAWASRAEATTS